MRVNRYDGTFLKFFLELIERLDNQISNCFRKNILGADLNDTRAFSLGGCQQS